MFVPKPVLLCYNGMTAGSFCDIWTYTMHPEHMACLKIYLLTLVPLTSVDLDLGQVSTQTNTVLCCSGIAS